MTVRVLSLLLASVTVLQADPAQYVDIINRGDDQAMLAFVRENYNPGMFRSLPASFVAAAHLAPYYGACGDGYDLIETSDPEAAGLAVLLRSRATGTYVRLRIPPGRGEAKLGGFPAMETVPTPAGAMAPPPVSDAEIVDRLGRCMDLMSKDEVFAGSVVLARDGEALFEASVGQAERAFGSRNRIDTKHNIASVGKLFTAVAMAKLVEEGHLAWTDPISQHLPEGWLQPDVAAQIQVGHLLSHTSGLGDYFRAIYQQQDRWMFRGLEDYKPLVADSQLAFEPGTQSAYSNVGMLLAGVIVQHVSGMGYFEYLQEQIFAPAGMQDTGGWDKDLAVENRATGYSREPTPTGARWWSNMETRVMRGSPSGGIYSTAPDLLRFASALREHRLLSPETTALVLSAKPEFGAPHTGFGFHLGEDAAGRVARHSGDGRGVNAEFSMYLDSGFTAVVLANQDRPAASTVQQIIHQFLMSRQQAP